MSVVLTTKQKTLLAFLAADTNAADPIRIMKGMFLISMKAPSKWLQADERYTFKPFDYGPCSFEIYDDLRYLEEKGFITSRQKANESWKRFQITVKGVTTSNTLKLNENLDSYISRLRQFVDSLSFSQLLKTVYKEFPTYAVNSVFRG